MLHERMTALTLWMTYEQAAKNLSERTLDLLRRLTLPNFLLANIYEKRVATEVVAYDGSEWGNWKLFYSEMTATKLGESDACWNFIYQKAVFSQHLIVPRTQNEAQNSVGNSKVKHKPKNHSGICANVLGKGSCQKPSIRCSISGWVHFTCSGLQRTDESKNRRTFSVQIVWWHRKLSIPQLSL